MLDHARGLGRGDRARRDRRPRHLQQLPQPAAARRHGAHGRPHQRPGEGRLVLGIGSGWAQRDYDEYGYAFGTAGSRLDDLAATCRSSRTAGPRCNPRPTRDIPILIGGGGEKKTLRIVAEHADVWHTFGDAETLARKGAVLDDWCAKVGRDPGTITWSAGVAPTPGRQPEQVEDYAGSAQTLYDAGVRLFTVGISGEAYGAAEWRDSLAKVRDLVAWRDGLAG